jgi:hypothetical protein
MSKVSRIIITEVIDWQGLSLSVTFDSDWSGLGYVAHIEVVTVKPDRAPNPISETGYKSHFLPVNEIESAQELRQYVLAWLEHAAKKSRWQASAQLSLF